MLKLINHPLITHKLSLIRRKETGTRDFRQNVNEIAGLMAYEITRDLPLREVVLFSALQHPKNFFG
jgi:uracil phosphoribosyltransferase